MRTIEYTTQFKRDYKREIKGKHKAVFSNFFVKIIDTLARDEPLALLAFSLYTYGLCYNDLLK